MVVPRVLPTHSCIFSRGEQLRNFRMDPWRHSTRVELSSNGGADGGVDILRG